jgi:predicted PurR-regulated permease PerM
LALVIVMLVHPVHRSLRRRGAPTVLALIVLLLIYGTLIVVVVIVAYSLARLATIMPAYAANAGTLLQGFAVRLAAIGIGAQQIRELIAALDLNRLAGWLTSGLRAVIGFGANVIFLLSLLLFMGIESTGVTQRLSTLMTTRPRTGAALIDLAVKTRRFLAVTGIFAVLVGVADTLLLLCARNGQEGPGRGQYQRCRRRQAVLGQQ